MKNIVHPIILLTALAFSGCEKKVVLTLKTEPAPVKIFAQDTLLGTSPIKLSEKELESFNLPVFEQIDTSPTTHWTTWDVGKKKGTIDVAHPHSPANRMTLRFLQSNGQSEEMKVSSFSVEHEQKAGEMKSTTMIFYLDSTNSSEAEDKKL